MLTGPKVPEMVLVCLNLTGAEPVSGSVGLVRAKLLGLLSPSSTVSVVCLAPKRGSCQD